MIKIANNLTVLCQTRHKLAADLRANDLVNMDSFGGGVADYLVAPGTPLGSWTSARKGRSSAMAEAVGLKPSYKITDPAKNEALWALGGGLLGGGLGLGAGLGIGEAYGNPAAPLLGGVGGAGLGIIGASLIQKILARAEMKRINNAFDAAPKLNKVEEADLGIGLLGGNWNEGRVNAETLLNNLRSRKNVNLNDVEDATYTGATGPILGAVGDSLASPFGGVLNGAFADRRAVKLRNKKPAKK